MIKTVIALAVAAGFATASFAQGTTAATPATPATPAAKVTAPATATPEKKVEAPTAAEPVKAGESAKAATPATGEHKAAQGEKHHPVKHHPKHGTEPAKADDKAATKS